MICSDLWDRLTFTVDLVYWACTGGNLGRFVH